jgi:hypothetical protein
MNLVPEAFSIATVMIWSSCLEVILGRLVRCVGRDPQHEVIERQHRHRRQFLPVERHARGKGGGKHVGERDDDLVSIALRRLDVEKALRAGTARLVDRYHRLPHQAVLGDHALGEARHLVRPAAGSGRDDELD